MTLDIPRYRLLNQFLSQTDFTDPAQVLKCLGAVQAQEYPGGKWALSLRMKEATDAALDNAFNNGRILRTHVLRPTWHFVAPEDIRWLLKLTGPRVHAVNGFIYRQVELDRPLLKKSYAVLEKALQGNQQLTRTELGSALEQAGIQNAQGVRLAYFMMSAELDGIICSGARKGKQFTYALLEERVPKVKALTREEGLVELTRRYFATRGPATLSDFTWWSGLTMADAHKGVDAIAAEFEHETISDQTYWFPATAPANKPSSTAYLLPNYDEYTVGYRDRSAIFDVTHIDKLSAFRESILTQVILVNGEISGTWKRIIKKNEVRIELAPFRALKKAEHQAVVAAAQRYGEFMQLPVSLVEENL